MAFGRRTRDVLALLPIVGGISILPPVALLFDSADSVFHRTTAALPEGLLVEIFCRGGRIERRGTDQKGPENIEGTFDQFCRREDTAQARDTFVCDNFNQRMQVSVRIGQSVVPPAMRRLAQQRQQPNVADLHLGLFATCVRRS